MSRNGYERWKMKRLRSEMAKHQLEVPKPPVEIHGRTDKIKWTRNYIVDTLEIKKREKMRLRYLTCNTDSDDDDDDFGCCPNPIFFTYLCVCWICIIKLALYIRQIDQNF
jgi:hypothetical protein